jgi:pimeloyl-ACP methyl ester carboxylesterase
MSRTLLILVAFVVIGYLALCVALFVFQRSLIYYPQPRALVGNANMITMPVDEGQVLMTTRAHPGPNAVVYFGGNAEDVSSSLPGLAAAFPEHALFLLHYRGYGGSSGKPTETALVADALALFDKVHAEHPNTVVVGRSLGSGVAVHVASLRPVARLVLVTPYDSLQELAARQFPWFPVRWLLQDKFESWRYAPQVSAPTLVIAAEHDETIPRDSTEALYARFRSGVASFQVVAGTAHNTLLESAQYLALLKGGQ